MKAVARQMVNSAMARIVNLSSVVGLRGNAGQVNYAASKAGVIRYDQIPRQQRSWRDGTSPSTP